MNGNKADVVSCLVSLQPKKIKKIFLIDMYYYALIVVNSNFVAINAHPKQAITHCTGPGHQLRVLIQRVEEKYRQAKQPPSRKEVLQPRGWSSRRGKRECKPILTQTPIVMQ